MLQQDLFQFRLKTILQFARQKVHLTEEKEALNMLSKSLYSQQGPFLLMFYRCHKTWLTSINWSPRENTSASKYQIKNRSGHLLHCLYFYKLRTNLLALSPFQMQCLTTRCQTEQTAHCFTNKPSCACCVSDPCPYLAKTAPPPTKQPHKQIEYTTSFSQLRNCKSHHN